jgi:hypothetical protein
MNPTALPFVNDRGELLPELDKFIYGLKQAPYKFQQYFREFLLGEGYVQLKNDECMFIKHTGDPNLFSIISIQLDDILQVSTCPKLVKKFGTITFHPKAEAYIGMSIDRSANLSTITISQVGLIDKILETYDRDSTKTTNDPHTENLFHPENGDTTPADQKKFLSLVMSLMYLARLTRPDILLPVVYLASRSHCCTMADQREAIRVCGYLRGTRGKGIRIHCTGLDVRVLRVTPATRSTQMARVILAILLLLETLSHMCTAEAPSRN